jgi:N-acetylglutamate synthase-like GNAT family acetyltransferase
MMRRAKRSDIESLQVLMSDLADHQISSEDMKERLQFIERSDFDQLFVCENENGIIGLLGFRIRENLEEKSKFAEISAIDVYVNIRRSGVGRFMMDYAEKLAKELQCKGMWLVSGFGREEEAHSFYERLGDSKTGYRFVKLFL